MWIEDFIVDTFTDAELTISSVVRSPKEDPFILYTLLKNDRNFQNSQWKKTPYKQALFAFSIFSNSKNKASEAAEAAEDLIESLDDSLAWVWSSDSLDGIHELPKIENEFGYTFMAEIIYLEKGL